MVNWPRPKSVKALRGFLGLTGYYRKFIKGYGVIARPLTELLKKNNFTWNPSAEAAFEKLKGMMSSTPVLGLPDFSKPFILETDASSKGLWVVLMQEGRLIAFLSKPIGVKVQGLSIYEKELLAVILVVTKWRHYLESFTFVIKIDHESLKCLLQQRLHTTVQQKGMTKLLGLSYTILYRKGLEKKSS